jgi:hypothetical protein
MKDFVVEYRANAVEYKRDGDELQLVERAWSHHSTYGAIEEAREALVELIVSHKKNDLTAQWEFRLHP